MRAADPGVVQLASEIAGEVITPDHGEYEIARRVWNGMIDRRPAAIARCASADDVATAIAFAAAERLPVAVLGGAHNVAGNATCDDGLVIDLAGLKRVQVDREARRARAGGGVDWGEFDAATQPHGLATTGGLMPSTGIAGFTLGGGLGHLMRSYGLACDNLVSAQVVTADGSRLRADAEQHPDLFWALRGGGGNFGVVTEFEFELHDVGPVLLGGRIAHSLADAHEALRFYREFCAESPDELIVYAGFSTGEDGEPKLGWRAVVDAPLAESEALVAPLREFGSPLLDEIQPRPYLEIQRIVEPSFPPGRFNYWKANFVDQLSDELIEVLIDAMRQVPSPHTIIAIEQMGGAVARVAETATAFRHPQRRFQPAHSQRLGRPCRHRRKRRLGAGAVRADLAAVIARGLRQLPRRRGRATRARRVRGQPRAPRPGQARVRPRQLLPTQPEHRAGGLAVSLTPTARRL